MIVKAWFNSIKDRNNKPDLLDYKIFVTNRQDFINNCDQNRWNDFTADSLLDKAFISISDSSENSPAVFKSNHQNVLNLYFDDTSSGISDATSQEIVNFIENNLGKVFYIHCNAGISRSGAIGKFIELSYDNYYKKLYNEGYLRPNISILSSLKRVLWQRRFSQGN